MEPSQPEPTQEQNQVPKPERPVLNTPISTPDERPIGSWAPAAQTESAEEPSPAYNQPESTPNLEPMISASFSPTPEQTQPELQAQQIGQEVTEITAPQEELQVQVPVQEVEPALTYAPDPLPKESGKPRKLLLSILSLIMIFALILGVYIFIFGTKAASSYKENSSISTYKEAFEQISQSLQKSPADKATLEAGINKLKIAEDNQANLSKILLGQLNPKYKKAQQLGSVIGEYRTNAKSFQEKYAFPTFLATLSESDSALSAILKLNQTDFKTTPIETFSQNVTSATDNCKQLITKLKEAAKPADLSAPTESFANSLSDVCTQLPNTIQDIVEGKSGLVDSADQEKIQRTLTAANNNISSIINGSSTSSFFINQLTAYARSAKDESASLLKEAEVILAE